MYQEIWDCHTAWLIFDESMKSILFLIMFLCISLVLSAQDQIVELSGKVVNGSTPVYNVSIADLNTYKGTVTDVYGTFKLEVPMGATLKFSSIGYKSVSYEVPDTLTSDKFRILVNMVPDTFLLKEAMVVPWPQNTTMLKKAMLDQKEEKQRISPYAGFVELEGDPVEPDPKPFANPISFIFSKLNKKSRQAKKMKKYKEILQEDDVYVPEPIY